MINEKVKVKNEEANILKIKECIEELHDFSQGLGRSTSVSKSILEERTGISPSEMQIALISMQDNREIEFKTLSDEIFLTENYQRLKP